MEHLLPLIDALHRAPDAVGAWQAFLDLLRAAIDQDVVAIFTALESNEKLDIVVGSGMGPCSVYLGDFLTPSVRHPEREALPLGKVTEIPAESALFSTTSLFHRVLAPAGALPGPGLVVPIERRDRQVLAAVLVLPTSHSWKPRASDRELLARLGPHLVIARRLQLRLARRGRETGALLAAFDHLVLGVVLLDERRRVSYANRSAAEILGFEAGFTDPAVLAAETPDPRTREFELLRQPDFDGKQRALIYRHPSDGRPLQVMATPLRWPQPGCIEGSRFAYAVFVCDPGQPSSDPLRVLHELYGLTRAQTHLALLLVGGCSLEEAAELLEISPGTARSVLKQVFEKTETHRQTDLVRLLLSVFGRIRAPTPPEPR